MPLVRIDWFPGRTTEQKRTLIDALTKEICRIGNCTPDSVTVMFNDVEQADWGRSGKLFLDDY